MPAVCPIVRPGQPGARVRCEPAGAAAAPGAISGGRAGGVPRRLRGSRGRLLRRRQALLLRLRARVLADCAADGRHGVTHLPRSCIA
jgi:hypothetical protein